MVQEERFKELFSTHTIFTLYNLALVALFRIEGDLKWKEKMKFYSELSASESNSSSPPLRVSGDFTLVSHSLCQIQMANLQQMILA